MKKTLLILLVAVASLTACKKDPEDKLKGRWDLVKEYDVQRLNGTITSEDTETYNIGDLYIVFEGNKYTLYEGGELEGRGTFSATDNSITLTNESGDSDTSPIKWNSKTEFVVIDEETQTLNGQTYSYKSETTFKKH